MPTAARTIRLRMTCPDLAACEATPTEFGVQDRHLGLHPGAIQAQGTIAFDIAVSVVRHPADGSVRYRGPFVHGTLAEPYLYLSMRPVGAEPGAVSAQKVWGRWLWEVSAIWPGVPLLWNAAPCDPCALSRDQATPDLLRAYRATGW